MENTTANSLPQQLRDARQEGIRHGKILATTKNLSMLTRNLKISLQEAMALLEIPRKERKTYMKILKSKEPQKNVKMDIDKPTNA